MSVGASLSASMCIPTIEYTSQRRAILDGKPLLVQRILYDEVNGGWGSAVLVDHGLAPGFGHSSPYSLKGEMYTSEINSSSPPRNRKAQTSMPDGEKNRK